MKQPRSLFAALLGTAVLVCALGMPRTSDAVPPAPEDESKAIAALVAEIATQQATIAENQKQIDAKLAAIAENLRVARIFVSRGGGAK